MPSILLVEDDLSFIQLIENFLKKKGFAPTCCHNLKEANTAIQKKEFDLILLDYHLPDGTAFDFIDSLHKQTIKTPVVIMTGFKDVRTVVKAMHLGAADYITKPVNPEELLMTIENTLHKKTAPILPETKKTNDSISGESATSKELNRHIELIAPTNMSVIIQGESGTGKEYVARKIHQHSERKHKTFIAIDCGALSDDLASSELFGHVKGSFTGADSDKKGVFELAEGGTLFMDEVGNLSYAIQVKLLRAIQEREIQPVGGNKSIRVDVRLITATNEELRENVKNGSFREDLYHRLNEFSIQVPPLRKRENDLVLFTQHFIQQSNHELSKKVKGISKEVLALFKTYTWPGNLRELRNIVRRAVLLAVGDTIQTSDIPEDMLYVKSSETPKTPDLKQMKEINEKELITKTLSDVKFNKTKAAALLNIDRKTLYLKMTKYGIEG